MGDDGANCENKAEDFIDSLEDSYSTSPDDFSP
jgi:hypothetical protein